MFRNVAVFGLALLACLIFTNGANRSFVVDWANNRFLKDGEPFQYVSGSMHYFRVPADLWRDRLRKFKYGGLNAVQTYVEWSSHEPKPMQYDFTGNNDILRFIKEAQEEGLLVILRVGPYICAERDMGGLPSWLLKSTGIELRTSDQKFLTPVDRWLKVLLPLIKPYLYENGGPIITLQVENEYGSWKSCDVHYTTHLRDTFRSIVGNTTVLFTTDGAGDGFLKCGPIENVFVTVDFGPGGNPKSGFDALRRHQAKGPAVNSEYYVGWFDYLEQNHSTRDIKIFTTSLGQMLKMNASVNIYLFHGGTSFGFKSAAHDFGTFFPITTSYDFDAPISEAGDLTEKFFKIKKTIETHFNVDHKQNIVPVKEKMIIPNITMTFKATVFDLLGEPIQNDYPLTFEEVDFDYGFMLYSANLTFRPTDPAILSVPDLRDRAQVYSGTMSRTRKLYNLPISAQNGSNVELLVENQGRDCYTSHLNEQKGIVGNVTIASQITINKKVVHVIEGWTQYKVFEDWNKTIEEFMSPDFTLSGSVDPRDVASFYVGNFTLPNKKDYPLDSFLRLDGWTKGVAFLNRHNLGRYWPNAGPQVTLYAPSVFFKPYPQINEIVLFELEKSPCFDSHNINCRVQFVDKHQLNGTVPNFY